MRDYIVLLLLLFLAAVAASCTTIHYHRCALEPDDYDYYYDEGFEYDEENPDEWDFLPGLDL